MAYRQLCAVTFVALGWLAAACGGGAASATKGGTDDGQPPNNATDQAPSNGAGDAARNGDKAPSSPDSPPASADAPAGSGASGTLGTLCRRFCDELSSFADNCSNDDVDIGGCDTADACQVPPGYIPCAQEIGDLFSCAIDSLQLLCSATNSGSGNGNGNGNGNGDFPAPQQQTAPCQQVLQDFEQCAEANGLEGTDNGMMTDGGNMPRGCYKAGGCVMCQDDCAACICDAGANAGTACLEACAP